MTRKNAGMIALVVSNVVTLIACLMTSSCIEFDRNKFLNEHYKGMDLETIGRDQTILLIDDTAAKKIELPDIRGAIVEGSSEVYDSVYAVALETTDESVIGYVSKLIVTQGYIYVVDNWHGNKVLRFGMDGKYLNQIGREGDGPGEYLQPSDVYIDKDITVLDQFQMKLITYDLAGKLRSEKKLPFICQSVIKLEDGGYIFKTGNADNGQIKGLTGYHVWRTDSALNIEGRAIHHDPNLFDNYFDCNSTRGTTRGTLMTNYFSDSLYWVSKDGEIRCDYILNFGDKRPTEMLYARNSEKAMARQRSGAMYMRGDIAESEDYIMVYVGCKGDYVMYISKDSDEVRCYRDIALDESNPFWGGCKSSDCTIEGNIFVKATSANQIIETYKQIVKMIKDGEIENITIGHEQEISMCEKLKPEDNPCVVFYKMKKR